MTYHFEKMTQENALIIANEWKYPGEYAFYDIAADEEDYLEFIDEEQRGDHYYQVLLNNEIVGFFTYTLSEGIADIGIGMKPNLTGKGLGSEFLKACNEYLMQKHPEIQSITLAVAQFNKRAIKVYEKLGFQKTSTFDQPTNGSIFPFVKMRKEISKD